MRWTAAMLLLFAAAGPAAGEALPRPAALEPQVRFWKRIYSEVDSQSGLIHDAWNLDVVYETVRLTRGLSPRAEERRVEAIKQKHIDALRRLASGARQDLSATEKHVLALWGSGVSNATLRAAAGEVRFQRGLADRFREGVIRSGLWEEHIREVFAARGIPPEVAALPHVESSFNPHAYSSVGAAGLWQFTRSTGRLYLRVDSVVDERMDPYKASDAAARLLLDNHRDLKVWPLSITAYNHGKGGLLRAVRQLGTRDLGVIVQRYRSSTFKFASRNFYTELLAAIEVERDAERYFGPLAKLSAPDYETVRLERYYHVASLEKAFGVDRKALREHNLALRAPVWRGERHVPKGYTLRVPRGGGSTSFAAALAAVPSEEQHEVQKSEGYYRVQRGDTLSAIARRHEVSERTLVSLNQLRSRNAIRAGQLLRLPGGEPADAIASAPAGGSYRVRSGDTLSSIARRHGVSATQLAAANGLRNRNLLSVGQVLKVPGSPARAAAPEPAPPSAPPVELAAAPAAETSTPAALVESSPAAAPASAPPVASLPEAAPAQAEAPAPPPPPLLAAAGDAVLVEPGETLTHYSSWLQVPSDRLRRLNGLRPNAALEVGRRVRLDFSQVSRETFDARRRQHHEAVRAEFFAAYRVAGTSVHVLRRGDSWWSLSRRHQTVPLWLLRQYNPHLDLSGLRPGVEVQIPRVERKST